jgi:hypothetical protein
LIDERHHRKTIKAKVQHACQFEVKCKLKEIVAIYQVLNRQFINAELITTACTFIQKTRIEKKMKSISKKMVERTA